MEAGELRELTADELMRKLADTERELFTLRLRVASQRPDATKIRKLRRDVARLKTVLGEQGVRV